MKTSILVVLSFACASYAIDQPHYDLKDAPVLFAQFINRYNKQYATTPELLQRYDYFKIHLQNVIASNAINDSAAFDINKDSDLSYEEFWITHGGWIPPNDRDTNSEYQFGANSGTGHRY